ncbi:MAG: hypothetical protein ABIU29_10965 [Chthoniobacterales bacterium]
MNSLPTVRLLGTLQDSRFGKSAASLFVWFILLFGRAAHGDPEWLANPVENNWFNAANWSTGTVPGPFDSSISESPVLLMSRLLKTAVPPQLFFSTPEATVLRLRHCRP